MYLKRLEIQGFKSFADKVEFEFPSGITAIVGPNGSGKSNGVDAIRWVLGEQSAKSLRGGKMEDVIFNGSSKRRQLGVAEVTLNFDNTDHALNIDFDEVSLTRRLYRSGDGEYLINNITRNDNLYYLYSKANYVAQYGAADSRGEVIDENDYSPQKDWRSNREEDELFKRYRELYYLIYDTIQYIKCPVSTIVTGYIPVSAAETFKEGDIIYLDIF